MVVRLAVQTVVVMVEMTAARLAAHSADWKAAHLVGQSAVRMVEHLVAAMAGRWVAMRVD